MTRRDLLARLGGGAMVALTSGIPAAVGARTRDPRRAAAGAGRALQAADVASARLLPFSLADVRLLDGPFLDAQKRDLTYLLLLQPDRMLHNFRVNAGLEPKAPVYGGWESEEPWVGIRCQGHTLGHYLSAASLMYASTGDARMKQRVDYIVAELQACQRAARTGLVCAFPDGAAQLENAVAGRRFIGVPWYTMHKIFAGLRDARLHADSAPALQVLTKLADWAIAATAPMTDEQFQHMLDTEHGGMNEVLADLAALTDESKYLALARRFSHRALLEPLADSRDPLDGLHANTQIPKVVGFQRLFESTGEDRFADASRFFWHTVVERPLVRHGRAWRPGALLPALRIREAPAVCEDDGDVLHAQHVAADASCSSSTRRRPPTPTTTNVRSTTASWRPRIPSRGMMTYFQATRPGYVRLFHTPERSFWCCTGTGMENHAKYGDSIYFRQPDVLWINLFIPSVVDLEGERADAAPDDHFPRDPRDPPDRHRGTTGTRHAERAATGLVPRNDGTRQRPPPDDGRRVEWVRRHRPRVAQR